jgi:hypothetical protein
VLLLGSSSSSASASATKSSFTAPVADGEADWLVFSIDELEEPLDAELDMPSSQGASVMRGVTN